MPTQALYMVGTLAEAKEKQKFRCNGFKMTQETSFTLEIVASTQSEIHSIEWVEIESPNGSFLVGPDHMPLISLIKKRSTLPTVKQTPKSAP